MKSGPLKLSCWILNWILPESDSRCLQAGIIENWLGSWPESLMHITWPREAMLGSYRRKKWSRIISQWGKNWYTIDRVAISYSAMKFETTLYSQLTLGADNPVRSVTSVVGSYLPLSTLWVIDVCAGGDSDYCSPLVWLSAIALASPSESVSEYSSSSKLLLLCSSLLIIW